METGIVESSTLTRDVAAPHAPAGVVVTLQSNPDDLANHESVTRNGLARRLATLKGYAFDGAFEPDRALSAPAYFLPAETIIGCDHAAALGIVDADDLFGAVVPYPYMATKSISHPLPAGATCAPDGWCHAFSEAVRHVVLEGYAAFSGADLRQAARVILAGGEGRLKLASGIGGQGQHVVRTLHEVDALLAAIDPAEIGALGIVVERNLAEIVTHSVGQVEVAGIKASYCGTQCLTTNNRGVQVYGGSTLLIVRGDFDILLAQPLAADARRAIDLARVFDAAALRHFTGMFASRRNYDVAIGVDCRGTVHGGVLEQSWRMGGASGAEVAALAAFQADPGREVIRVATTEVYGKCAPPPAHAEVYFRAVDTRAGMLTKFTVVETDADA
ncbi:MAG: DUF3182 family protein [Casimicrobiaceae bacterium]